MTTKLDTTQGNVRTIVLEPGNASRYIIVLSRLSDETCRLLGADEGSLLVAIPNHNSRTMLFHPNGGTSAVYMHEKLDVTWGDADVLAPFLNNLRWGDQPS